ncbi:CHAT domain-containing protein [Vibrio parahaemolyticus]|uniref:CHAT domain-containing protein n=1 Tax=Vibrio parahaemolyticus TaxID=670 RepID=UPI002269CE9F|nr:CHAT domain-containing protein [Vibrio parahaemolyticus]MCX8861859.1 CHAT domain-containing protein [Vibrio parahaemolyticus]MCX8870201.1 CHAT domain-containing protein [Vibrio parahaemolyticus]
MQQNPWKESAVRLLTFFQFIRNILSFALFALSLFSGPVYSGHGVTPAYKGSVTNKSLVTLSDKIRSAMESYRYEQAYELQGKLIELIGYEINSQNFTYFKELYSIRKEFPALGDPVSLITPFERFSLSTLSEKEAANLAKIYFNENMPYMAQSIVNLYVSEINNSALFQEVNDFLSVLDSYSIIPVTRNESDFLSWLRRLLVYPSTGFSLHNFSGNIDHDSLTDPLRHYIKVDDLFNNNESGKKLKGGSLKYDSLAYHYNIEFISLDSMYIGGRLDPNDKTTQEIVYKFFKPFTRCADLSSDNGFSITLEDYATLQLKSFEVNNSSQVNFIYSNELSHLGFVFFRVDDRTPYTCFKIFGSTLDIVDLNNDEKLELIISSSSGSANWFKAVLLSIESQSYWVFPELYKGYFKLIDIDGDSNIEILQRGLETNRLIQSCNTCPARVNVTVFDLGRDNILRYKGEIMGSTESQGILNPDIFRFNTKFRIEVAHYNGLDIDRDIDEVEYFNSVDEVEYFNSNRHSHLHYVEEFFLYFYLGDMYNAKIALYKYLVSVHELEVYGRLSEAFESLNNIRNDELIEREFPLLWVKSNIFLAKTQYLHGNIENFSETIKMTINTANLMEKRISENMWSDIKNMDLISSVLLGDFEYAEQLVSKLSTVESESTIGSNIALLYNRLASWELASEKAVETLEKSFMQGNLSTASVNSLYQAEALYEMDYPNDAINWLYRAVSLARTEETSGVLFESLLLAAQFAVDIQETELARAFLAESITQVSVSQWNVSAAKFFILMSRTASTRELKLRYLHMASNHARDRNRQDFASAKYFEGIEYLKLGERNLAIDSLLEAFGSVKRRRIDIGSTNFKLSHLVDSEKIYIALSRALYEAGQLEKLFDISDDWKLQAFLDELSVNGHKYNFEGGMEKALRLSKETNAYIVSFIDVDRKTLAFVFENGLYRVIEIKGYREEIQTLSDEIKLMFDVTNSASLSKIKQNRISSSDLDKLRDGYNLLIRPLELVSGKTVYIVPSDSLVSLPWAALAPPPNFMNRISELLRGKSGYYPMAKKFAVSILPSIGLIKQDPTQQLNKVLVAYSEGPFELSIEPYRLVELAEVRHEAELVSNAYGSTNKLANLLGPADFVIKPENSLVEAIKEIEPGVIHFAAHGVFNQLKPLDSFMVLGKQQNPYLLRASDISKWDSPNLSLVTIAACQSGAQKMEVGGEFFGFTRAFFLAGANTVVASPWLVPDEAAKIFFVNFHNEIAVGKSVGSALQAAQSAVRDDFKHPFYWASFYVTTLSITP